MYQVIHMHLAAGTMGQCCLAVVDITAPVLIRQRSSQARWTAAQENRVRHNCFVERQIWSVPSPPTPRSKISTWSSVAPLSTFTKRSSVPVGCTSAWRLVGEQCGHEERCLQPAELHRTQAVFNQRRHTAKRRPRVLPVTRGFWTSAFALRHDLRMKFTFVRRADNLQVCARNDAVLHVAGRHVFHSRCLKRLSTKQS